MKKYSFEKALRNTKAYFKVTGKGVEKLSDEFRIFRLIKNGLPLPFDRINDSLKKCLDELDYIQFWSDVELYKIEDQEC